MLIMCLSGLMRVMRIEGIGERSLGIMRRLGEARRGSNDLKIYRIGMSWKYRIGIIVMF